MTLDELKTRVKIKVDEYTPAGVSHAFDDYLEPMIQESADELSDKAPLYLLEPTVWVEDLVDGGDGINIRYEDDLALIDTPSDFARIYEVKFPQWKRSVHLAITPDNPDYEKQQNEYTKAGYGRPAVYLKTGEVESELFAKLIICGKVLDGALPSALLYIAYKTAANMPNVLDEAMTWLAASKILQVLGDSANAQLAEGRHQTDLQIKNR